MARRDVTARTGERWQVRLVWAPRLWDDTVGTRMRRRWRRYKKQLNVDSDDQGWWLTELIGPDEEWGLVVVGLVLGLLIALFVLVFALPLLIEVLVLVAVAALGIAGKVLLRRPWTIAADSDDGTRTTWRVVGWSASRAHVEAVAHALEHGHPLPSGGTTTSVSR